MALPVAPKYLKILKKFKESGIGESVVGLSVVSMVPKVITDLWQPLLAQGVT
jgi:hypothetical protein